MTKETHQGGTLVADSGIASSLSQPISRRTALRTAILGGAGLAALGSSSRAASPTQYPPLKGRIKHSVAYWPFGRVLTLDEFCLAMKQLGYSAISHCRPYQWSTLKAHGLDSSLADINGEGERMDFENGLVTAGVHDELVARYLKAIDLAADAGYGNLLCAGGNRRGMDREEGLTNAETCLKRILGHAEKRGVVLAMAMGNTRQHPDYFFDDFTLGVSLCKRMGSPSFGLIYDIYHRQLMEGNIRGNIGKYHEYFVYYHTGGVPGRHEPGDPDQELNYPAICRAIVETGYKGYLAQEYFPRGPRTKANIIASLHQSIHVCDV